MSVKVLVDRLTCRRIQRRRQDEELIIDAVWKLVRAQATDPILTGFPYRASTPGEFWAVKSFAA